MLGKVYVLVDATSEHDVIGLLTSVFEVQGLQDFENFTATEISLLAPVCLLPLLLYINELASLISDLLIAKLSKNEFDFWFDWVFAPYVQNSLCSFE